jgi:hypothetical protein
MTRPPHATVMMVKVMKVMNLAKVANLANISGVGKGRNFAIFPDRSRR